MKKLAYLLIISIFYCALVPTTIKTIPSNFQIKHFCLGFLGGTIPIIGQANVMDALVWFSVSRKLEERQIVAPAAVGLIVGSANWVGLAELFKTQLPKEDWKAYLYASLPGPATLGLVYHSMLIAKP